MSINYMYNEAEARFYDTVYDSILDKSGFNFYQEEIVNVKGKVLEVGVGTGRIFIPALKNGADIYGIDQSELMLGKLKEKITPDEFHRVKLQDVRELNLPEKFELAISPFRVFGHLHTPDDQLAALNKIYDHLEPGGKFIFDLFVPDYRILSQETIDSLDYAGEYAPGQKLYRYAHREHDNINQLVNVNFKYKWQENGGNKEANSFLPLRYYFRYELENLIARSKLTLEKIYGSFSKSDLDNTSKDFIIVCVKE